MVGIQIGCGKIRDKLARKRQEGAESEVLKIDSCRYKRIPLLTWRESIEKIGEVEVFSVLAAVET